MRAAFNLSGKRFGRLTVLSFAGVDKKRTYTWLCSCDCGNQKVIVSTSLRAGLTKSCGCIAKEILIGRLTTHGQSDSEEYAIWASMKRRCRPQDPDRKYYFDRGIIVCSRWAESFSNFVSDMGKRPKGGTIDRIDTNGNYCPENCRWATMKEQNNNRRDNRIVEFNGQALTLSQWEDYCGIDQRTIWKRLNRGWPIAEAISTPKNENKIKL